MFAKSIVIFMLIYVYVSSSASAGSCVMFRFSIFLVSVKYTLFLYHKNSCEVSEQVSKLGFFLGSHIGRESGFSKKNGKIPTTSGWLDSLLYPYTKMSSTVCRIQKRMSSKYFKTNQNAKLCFYACLNFAQFLADILHLTQKAAKCTTCKHLFGKS